MKTILPIRAGGKKAHLPVFVCPKDNDLEKSDDRALIDFQFQRAWLLFFSIVSRGYACARSPSSEMFGVFFPNWMRFHFLFWCSGWGYVCWCRLCKKRLLLVASIVEDDRV